MNTYLKFTLLIVAIIGTLVWLAAGGINETKTYYKTVAELNQMGDKALGERIRVAGDVKEGSIARDGRQVSFTLEQEAFLSGHYFAFSMSDCGICPECAGFRGKPCVNPRQARPAFHSVGIDVFATVKQFGLPLAPLKSEDEVQNWYSAVFVA